MKKYLKNLRNLSRLFGILLLIFTYGISANAQDTGATDGNTNQTAAATPTVLPVPTPIPISDIVSQSEAASKKLQEIRTNETGNPGIQVIEEELPILAKELDSRTTAIAQLLSARPSLEILRQTEQDWESLSKSIPTWKRNLRAQLNVLETQFKELQNLADIWQKTLDSLINLNNPATSADTSAEGNSAAQTESSVEIPPVVLQRINEIIAEIQQTQKQIEEKRSRLLTLQTRISEQETRVNDTLAAIKEVREEALTHLFVKDSPAIWNIQRQGNSAETLIEETRNSFAVQSVTLSEYARRQSDRFILHGVVFLIFFGALVWARRRIRPLVKIEPELEGAVIIFKMPLATALILGALLSDWFYPQAPRFLTAILGVLAIVPVVILLRQLLEKPLFPILNALVVFYFVDHLREITASLPLVSRILFLAEILGAIIFLIWFLHSKRLSAKVEARHFRIYTVVKKAIPLTLFIFAAAFLANLFGYVSLSNVIGNSVLGSAYIALILYTAVQIIKSLLIFAFRLEPFASLRMVAEHRELIRLQAFRILKWLAVLVWIILTLNLLSLRETVFSYIQGIFASSLTVGSFSISLGDVVIFVVTIWLAFVLSRFLRFVLEEDVYTRVDLAGGIPYAISTMLHYALLVIGFLIAISALGFDLTKFTILAGALGVGLGFGLQTIVSNFVSGLILLFERPVKVGDTVQLGEHQGNLNRIGLRASVLRKVDGSDVIVPNSQLISEEVINWTLSDQQRRLDINVGVAYGNDPEEIIELLTKVGLEHKNIMELPPPRTLFIGFGDNSLDFQFRAWTDQTDNWVVTRSELAVGVYKALREANIEIPFPQRDLNLKIVSAENGETIRKNLAEQNTSNSEKENVNKVKPK